MPTYDFKCTKCGYEFEEVKSIKDDSPAVCKKCHSPAEKTFGPGTRVGIVWNCDPGTR